MTKPKLIAIVGPTASGKTTLAIKLALRLSSGQTKKFSAKGGPTSGWNGAEIVSADSRQVYRGMDIGTAKPTLSRSNMDRTKTNGNRILDRNSIRFGNDSSSNGIFDKHSGVRHYCVDVKNPNEPYTVSEYKRDALKIIRSLIVNHKLPILVGGTGLYIKAIVDNLDIPEVKADLKLRAKLDKELKLYGVDYLFQKLIALDPEAAYIVDPKNHRRIIRALEIAIKTKKPFSAQRKIGKELFNTLQIGIDVPKEKLKEKIYKRVDQMIKDGLVTEVINLVKKYGASQTAFDAIGYREIIDYLEGKITLDESIELIKKKTYGYAKRQLTWFKKDKRIHWVKNEREITPTIQQFLKSSS
jgi:tRNA dimethylallyltransferase